MFRPSSLLCSTCNSTDVASSSYYSSPAGDDQGSSSRALLVVNGAIDKDLFVASLRRDLSAEPSRSPLLSTTSAMVVSTTEEQVHRGFVVVKRSPVKMEGVMRVITSGNDCFVNVVGMSISLEKKVAIPLVCLGDSRPVVDLFYSSVTPDGYFLISASKGRKQLALGRMYLNG
ncbi:hypothetical protein ZEAMMB73_Zm00001d006842 [Zea mays]|uniref:Uncharacterized protein n=1 Tax=Zea mays TaxID=4577 RepID=A0A1D6F171_MAIZE|nr:hypothetical protein ZEAMMB73_Zm00001d006842 [Zea mays]